MGCFPRARFDRVGQFPLTQLQDWVLPFLGIFVFLLIVKPVLLSGVEVRVPEGTLVRLALHYDLTTENVVEGDRVDFDVVDNVSVDNHVVIPKGALAWAIVVRVKGAGKRNAKDASVTIRFAGVRTVDGQNLALHLLPYKNKKPNADENNIVESSPIPGLRERMIGAEKGKQYAAYTGGGLLVNVAETPPASSTVAVTSSAVGAASGQERGSTKGGASLGTAQRSTSASFLPPETAVINFRSQPSGADILMDGNLIGSTPSTLRVPPGQHEIEIRIQGYRSWKRKMKVEPGSHPTVLAALAEKEN